MTDDRTTPDDSTPRRGFGWARSVLRAVKGAVEATREAAQRFALRVEEERLAIELHELQRELRRRQAARRPRPPKAAAPRRPIVPLEERLPFMPLEIRRLFMQVMAQGWRALQPQHSRWQQMRRYYLGRTAEWPADHAEVLQASRDEEPRASDATARSSRSGSPARLRPSRSPGTLRAHHHAPHAPRTHAHEEPYSGNWLAGTRPSAATPLLISAPPRQSPRFVVLLSSVFCFLFSERDAAARCGPGRCWAGGPAAWGWRKAAASRTMRPTRDQGEGTIEGCAIPRTARPARRGRGGAFRQAGSARGAGAQRSLRHLRHRPARIRRPARSSCPRALTPIRARRCR